MTAFNPSQIPTTGPNAITTLEQLAVWVGLALNTLHPTTTAIEGDGAAQRVSQFGEFYVPNNNTYRAIIRLSIPINNNFPYSGTKIWASATEIDQTPLIAAFNS